MIQTADPHNGWGSTGDARLWVPASTRSELPDIPSDTLTALSCPPEYSCSSSARPPWAFIPAPASPRSGGPRSTSPTRRSTGGGRCSTAAPRRPDEVMLTAPLVNARVSRGRHSRAHRPARSYTVVGCALACSRGSESVVAAPGTLIGGPGASPPTRSTHRRVPRRAPRDVGRRPRAEQARRPGHLPAVILDPPATTPFDEQSAATARRSPTCSFPCSSPCRRLPRTARGDPPGRAAFAVGRDVRLIPLRSSPPPGHRRDLRRVVLGAASCSVSSPASSASPLASPPRLPPGCPRWLGPRLTSPRSTFARSSSCVVVAVGVVTGILAAVVPARQAARIDVVAALRGQRGSPAPSRRTPIVGVVDGARRRRCSRSWAAAGRSPPNGPRRSRSAGAHRAADRPGRGTRGPRSRRLLPNRRQHRRPHRPAAPPRGAAGPARRRPQPWSFRPCRRSYPRRCVRERGRHALRRLVRPARPARRTRRRSRPTPPSCRCSTGPSSDSRPWSLRSTPRRPRRRSKHPAGRDARPSSRRSRTASAAAAPRWCCSDLPHRPARSATTTPRSTQARLRCRAERPAVPVRAAEPLLRTVRRPRVHRSEVRTCSRPSGYRVTPE